MDTLVLGRIFMSMYKDLIHWTGFTASSVRMFVLMTLMIDDPPAKAGPATWKRSLLTTVTFST